MISNVSAHLFGRLTHQPRVLQIDELTRQRDSELFEKDNTNQTNHKDSKPSEIDTQAQTSHENT